MDWKMFEEYQDICLVLISEWNDFIYSESPCCLVSAQENIWVGRRCLKNSKKAV